MRKQILFAIILVFVITACIPSEEERQIITPASIVKISNELPTPTTPPTETVIPTPTNLPTETSTATPTETQTETPTATQTATTTDTPSPTPNPIQPFSLHCLAINNNPTTSTSIECMSGPVPQRKRFVVEHISGSLAVKANSPVDRIQAFVNGGYRPEVYLPTHFASSEVGGPNNLISQVYQFGSPVNMYIDAGQRLIVRGDSTSPWQIVATAIGYLVDL